MIPENLTEVQIQALGLFGQIFVGLCICFLAFLVSEIFRFPPVWLARRFSYFRLRRLLAWSRLYKDLFGEAPPCVEYFVDYLADIGEQWLVPDSWSGSPSDWWRDSSTEATALESD